MKKAQKGDQVSFNFIVRLDDGSVIDSTYDEVECETDHEVDSGPMQLTIGDGTFFTQVEQALVDMTEGATKNVVVPAEDAFGAYDPDQVFSLQRDQIPMDFTPEEGDLLELSAEDSDQAEVVKVLAVGDDEITLDANHPYAGQRLNCEIALEKILS
ncbi:peptidylprolyl isomerase [Desulfuromonas acetoxidans]|uniref:Peptidyl-prolyl cis-trans isomerase n=1 Tax=Desulfuromonas acetoxidans (strain DSM 684 / 11070) TaxID=281689 RepID=Q1K1F9_DESA6|nr:FKBP-type peptidyl-prolyl cis-trans isomerase [Desulfuromonas acetoxidans]EAT16429.1 peptidylprolyl isomerase, FKBP-type [Desulfuromonas acetoxidans DSM 684]MBF0644375.1 FKBP-type peptidyl-prolyl cis-trans isomerase [Desulfuromonas acetoxidans]NVD23569.1 FKBP-type peptidyl-prolyl cis-trans isomerase [Desulfuromonas acetoxidans]NVE16046.1 FKBP-type peptidyl-prolyl cis-trans isomerase [Desulfuromonas acetoxidans]